VCVARARRLLVDLIFFPDFLSGRVSPVHLPPHQPYRIGFDVVRRAFREHLTRTRHTHLLTSRTHTRLRGDVTGKYSHTHTRARARTHTYSRSRTHSRTGCQNNRAVRFSAGCSSDPRKQPQTPSRHRCEDGRHVDVMIDMIRRPIVAVVVAAIPLGHQHLEGAPSS